MWTLIRIVWGIFTLAVLLYIWTKSEKPSTHKLMWSLAVLLLPFLGPLAWIFFGDRPAK